MGWVGLDRITQNGPMDNSGLLLPVCCGLCVSLLDIIMSCAKTDERIEMMFWLWTRVSPRSHVLDGGPRLQTDGEPMKTKLKFYLSLCQTHFSYASNRLSTGGSVAEWLACWIQAQKLSGNSLWRNCSNPSCLCSPSSEIDSSPLKGCDGNCGPGGK